MKKTILLLTVALITASMLLSGCGGAPETEVTETTSAPLGKPEFSDNIKGFLDYEGHRLTEFDETTVHSEEFSYDFIFYFYTSKNFEAREQVGGAMRVPWSENEVNDMFTLLFGTEMTPIYPTDGNTGVIYENGNYWVWPSDFGDEGITFNSVRETDSGIDVVYDYVSGGELVKYKVFSLEAADNERGWIITAVRYEEI